eukprot:XP_014787368.1 PREDICTED: histidine triad nucleotide-binding protein 3-like [Octopus bimaculoides]
MASIIHQKLELIVSVSAVLFQDLLQDTDVVVFPDIRPVSSHHYLVTPKQHIRDAKHLTSENIGLGLSMERGDEELVEEFIPYSREMGLSNVTPNGRKQLLLKKMGFHWPPFHSVNHLHLHVISPLKEMRSLSRAMFKLNSFWFVSPVWVLARLKNSAAKQAGN